MKIITPKREFIKDEKAVSEEFTSLPALSVVMIGFALFILLVANTYSAYTTRTENLNKYQTADFIATKLTNPDSFIIKEGGIINLPVFKNSEAEINKLRQKYQASGIDFVVIVNYENNQIKQPICHSNIIEE